MMRPLGIDDAPDVQRLFERCADFFELIEGAPPRPEKAMEELTFTLPGHTIDDTFHFGVYEDQRLIAFAQVLRDYPNPSEWWIGLLLLDPDARGRGLGEEVHRWIIEWTEQQAGTTMGLIVQTQNKRAEGFWLRLGYVERERRPEIVILSQPLRTSRSSPSP